MVDSIGLIIELPMAIVLEKMKKQIMYSSKGIVISKMTTKCWHISKRNNMTRIGISLPKFIQGNNLYDLSFSKIRIAVRAIIKMLNIPPEKILLYRVDISFNIILKHSTTHYISQFNQIENYSMDTYFNERNCMYSNKETSIIFYDKLFKEFRGRIPEKFIKYKNRVMRIEVQRKLKIKDIYNYQDGNITILALLDKKILEFFLKYWLDCCTLIINSRSNRIPARPNTELVKTAGQLQKHISYLGLLDCGYDNIKSFWEKEIKKGYVRHDMKNKISEINAYGRSIKTNEQNEDFILLKEKIRKIYQRKMEELKNY